MSLKQNENYEETQEEIRQEKNCQLCGRFNLKMVVNGDLLCEYCNPSDFQVFTPNSTSIWKDPKSNFSIQSDWDSNKGIL